MLYKTIMLELLQQRPQLHDRLRRDRTLLPTLERLASELRTSHEAWKQELGQASPGSDPSQIASEALELALKELETALPSASSEEDPLFLEAALAYLRRHTPSA